MSTTETIQHVRDIDPDYPACTVLLKGRIRADLIESAMPCHDAQVVGPYRDTNPMRFTVLAAMSED